MTVFRRNTLLQLCSIASFFPLAAASKVSSTVKVHLPKELQRPNGYDHREALFGIPPYGGSIQQNVIYTSDDLCEPALPANNHWKAPFILMVDRGGCTFVQKVRNGQHAGAAAVIIADNTCQCKHDKICTPEGTTSCEQHEPIMADDGSGFDITIPSVLLFKQDADPIKEALNKKKPVRMELAWSLPNPDDHVELDLWTSPTDYASLQFKEDFRDAMLALASRVTFVPHMYIYDGIDAMCRTQDGTNLCESICTNQGRYCSTDPDGNFDSGISGADVVAESINRLCIWEIFGGDGIGLEWWDYIHAFNEMCNTSELFMDDDCVKSAMETAGIEYDRVGECIFEHGGLESDEQNDLLQKQLLDKESSGVVIMPVSYVNGVAVRGALEFATIFKAVCAGYASGTEPAICDTCANCSDEQKCVKDRKCVDDVKTVNIHTFAGSLISVSILFTVVGVSLFLRQRKHMRDEVRGILKEYMPVERNGLTMPEYDTALEQDDNDDFKGTFS
mmetsp:Transcript_9745/g.10777  ORF Transcript_9745/g.10777 Transcript_9745/m.10777 type:complete len:504 (+) Transcript_9745:46-1557(+)